MDDVTCIWVSNASLSIHDARKYHVRNYDNDFTWHVMGFVVYMAGIIYTCLAIVSSNSSRVGPEPRLRLYGGTVD